MGIVQDGNRWNYHMDARVGTLTVWVVLAMPAGTGKRKMNQAGRRDGTDLVLLAGMMQPVPPEIYKARMCILRDVAGRHRVSLEGVHSNGLEQTWSWGWTDEPGQAIMEIKSLLAEFAGRGVQMSFDPATME